MNARTATRRMPARASFGSVRKLPSGRYQARYSDARMNRHTAPQTFATKRQAEDWLSTIRADMVRGTWRAPELGTVTLVEYATAHLATRLDLAPKTQQLYASVLRNWLARPLARPLALPPGHSRNRSAGPPATIDLGSYELGALSMADVREWHAAALHTASENARRRAETHRARLTAATTHAARRWALTQGLSVKPTGRLPRRVLDAWQAAGSPSTSPAVASAPHVAERSANAPGRAQVAQAYRLLRMILGHALREGRIDANPCQISRAGQVKSSERVPATPAEVDALAAAMPARYAAAVQVAAWSGLRAGELFALARRHVDLDAGTLRVERAVTYLTDRPAFFGPTKTDASRRTVYLPPHVVDILRGHLATYTAPGPDALVFADPQGHIVTREARLQAFWRARAVVGRTDLRWHDLRHTGATLAAQAGGTLRELQHRLGHTTTAAAMIYQHHSADRDRDLAQRMSSLAATLQPARLPSPAADQAAQTPQTSTQDQEH